MIPIRIKRKMLMHKDTHAALKSAGFEVLPVDSGWWSFEDGILWCWGYYGGEVLAHIIFNNPNQHSLKPSFCMV